MAERLRILITNNTLAKPAGTELSVLDYATTLHARGHQVAAYSQHLGEIAERLREAGVNVVDDLSKLPWRPQIIHGHHEWETTVAALRFADVPVVSFCRGPYNWQEAPCLAPNVVLWAAVDEACRDRLVSQHGVPADKVELVLNGIDLDRFTQRPEPVASVHRVLIFSNYASEQNYVPVVRAACQKVGAELTVIGAAVGNIHPRPQEILGDFDVVFAKGKAALEALAVGCAVVVCDSAGLGPLVSTDNFEKLRRLSFGNPCMTEPIESERVASRLVAVSVGQVGEVAAHVRSTCSLGATIDRLEAVYARASSCPVSVNAESLAAFASSFLDHKTQAYKLGRKMREFWHAQREPDAPDRLDAVKVDRILDVCFNSESKLARLRAKIEKLEARLEKTREVNKKEEATSFGARLRSLFR